MFKISGPTLIKRGENIIYPEIGDVIDATTIETKHCVFVKTYYTTGILLVTKTMKGTWESYNTLYSIKIRVKSPRIKKSNHQPRLDFIHKKYDAEPRKRPNNVWFGYLRGYRRAIKDLVESGVLK